MPNLEPQRHRPLRSCRPWTPPCARLLPALVVSCLASCNQDEPKAAPQRSAPPPVAVSVAPVEQRGVLIQLEAIGSVVPIRTVSVRARAGGELTSVGFRKGQEVKTGDLLFQLDPRPFQNTLAQAEAQLKRDQVLAGNANVESRRYRHLVDGGFVGSQQYDQARANASAASATLALDQVAVDSAKLNLEYTTILSPIDGRTGDLLVDVGNLVTANSERALVVINQLRPIDVSFSVPEENLGELRTRMAAGTLRVEARPPPEGTLETGELTFVDNTVDPATGTILLKATFANADGALWPGQYVDVVLVLGARSGAIVVPAAAVQTGQQGRYVFVVKADRTAEVRPVEVVTIDERQAVIGTGLTAGETVVTDGQFRLVPGSRVKVGGSDAGTPAAPPR